MKKLVLTVEERDVLIKHIVSIIGGASSAVALMAAEDSKSSLIEKIEFAMSSLTLGYITARELTSPEVNDDGMVNVEVSDKLYDYMAKASESYRVAMASLLKFDEPPLPEEVIEGNIEECERIFEMLDLSDEELSRLSRTNMLIEWDGVSWN